MLSYKIQHQNIIIRLLLLRFCMTPCLHFREYLPVWLAFCYTIWYEQSDTPHKSPLPESLKLWSSCTDVKICAYYFLYETISCQGNSHKREKPQLLSAIEEWRSELRKVYVMAESAMISLLQSHSASSAAFKKQRITQNHCVILKLSRLVAATFRPYFSTIKMRPHNRCRVDPREWRIHVQRSLTTAALQLSSNKSFAGSCWRRGVIWDDTICNMGWYYL